MTVSSIKKEKKKTRIVVLGILSFPAIDECYKNFHVPKTASAKMKDIWFFALDKGTKNKQSIST